MEIKTKKIIAREFLIFIISLIAVICSYFINNQLNNHYENKIKSINTLIKQKNNELINLTSPIHDLYSEYNIENKLSIRFIDFENKMQEISYRKAFYNRYN